MAGFRMPAGPEDGIVLPTPIKPPRRGPGSPKQFPKPGPRRRGSGLGFFLNPSRSKPTVGIDSHVEYVR